MDGLLDAPQSPILLLLYHFHIIPVNHMVQGGCMFGKSRLVVSVCRFLPLVPSVGSPLSDIGHLNSVVFELDIQGSSSLSYVAQRVFNASYLVEASADLLVSFLSFNLNRYWLMVLAGLKALEMTFF